MPPAGPTTVVVACAGSRTAVAGAGRCTGPVSGGSSGTAAGPPVPASAGVAAGAQHGPHRAGAGGPDDAAGRVVHRALDDEGHRLGPDARHHGAEAPSGRLREGHADRDVAPAGGRQGDLAHRLAPVLEGERHPCGTGAIGRVADQQIGLDTARPADFPLGQPPRRAGGRGTRGVVPFTPARGIAPPHRPLDDHRHVGSRREGGGDGGVGQRGALLVDPHREATGGRHGVRPRHHRPIGLEIARLHRGRLVARVGQEEEEVEEGAGGPFGKVPGARRGGHGGALVAGPEQLPADGSVHGALDDDRHAVGDGDRGRDFGSGQGGVLLIHPDRPSAARRHRVGLQERRRGRRQQIAHGDGGGRVARILEQVKEIEARDGGALGQHPRRLRGREAGLGVAAVAGAVPGHGAVREERLVGLDHRGELGLWQPQGLGIEGDALVAGERDGRGDLGGGRRLEAHGGGGRLAGGIEQGQLRVEEGAGGALGEVAREVAGRDDEAEVEAVVRQRGDGRVDRRDDPARLRGRDGVGAAGGQAGEGEAAVGVGDGRCGGTAGQRHRQAGHRRPGAVLHLPAHRGGRRLRGGRAPAAPGPTGPAAARPARSVAVLAIPHATPPAFAAPLPLRRRLAGRLLTQAPTRPRRRDGPARSHEPPARPVRRPVPHRDLTGWAGPAMEPCCRRRRSARLRSRIAASAP